MAHSFSKPAHRGYRHLIAALLCGTALVPVQLSAQGAPPLPTGGQQVDGQVTIVPPSSGGTVMQINQGTSRAIIDWTSFDIANGYTVNVLQLDANSVLLNRVTGSQSTNISGTLSANGQVFVVNPNGIIVGETGRIETSGFVGSTLGISDADFMAGRLDFSGDAPGAVRNEGIITIYDGGYAALIGGRVENAGTIVARLGKVGLGAGQRVTLDLAGNQFLQVALSPEASSEFQASIEHSGHISADGGLVEMRAAAARDAARNVVNLSGTLEARTVSGVSGRVVLGGGEGGGVVVSGGIDVSVSDLIVDVSPVPMPRPVRDVVIEVTGETILFESDLTWGENAEVALTANSLITLAGDLAWDAGSRLSLDTQGEVLLSGMLTITGGDIHITADTLRIAGGSPGGGEGSDEPGSGDSLIATPGGVWHQVGLGSDVLNFANFHNEGGSLLRVTGGEGSSGNPYVIGDALGLQGIGSNGYETAAYALGDDIQLANLPWGFVSLGGHTAFGGSLDGAGHTISGLTQINRPDGVGLFAQADGATIQRLNLSGVNIEVSSSEEYRPIGALLGMGTNVTLADITVSGDISVTAPGYGSGEGGASIGGIAGDFWGGSATGLGSQVNIDFGGAEGADLDRKSVV